MKDLPRHYGLRGFRKHREVGLKWVVEEFYAAGAYEHLTRIQPGKIWTFDQISMRGCVVDFSKEAIRTVLSLPRVEGCAYSALFDSNKKQLVSRDVITATIAVSGTKWSDKNNLPRRYLTPKAAFLYEFIRHDIQPTTNTTEVTVERALLVHLILQEQPIDFGTLICDALVERMHRFAMEYASDAYAKKKRPPDTATIEPVFLFPSLITCLCRRSSIPLIPDEPELKESVKLTFPLPERPTAPLPAPRPGPPHQGPVTNAALSDKLDMVIGSIKMLRQGMETLGQSLGQEMGSIRWGMQSLGRCVGQIDHHLFGGQQSSHTHLPQSSFYTGPLFADEPMYTHTELVDNAAREGRGVFAMSGAIHEYHGSGMGTIVIETTKIVDS